MYSFKNDYAEGAHPLILEQLLATNLQQDQGYGLDKYSGQARELIKEELANKHAQVFFSCGGTQANLLVISHLLKPYQAVISSDVGHIYTNEAGAIEATGHKVIACASENGKINVTSLAHVLKSYSLKPHVVEPKVVYISNSTELGTIYCLEELKQLYQFCKKNDLLLFVDGARLAHAICADKSDLTFKDMGVYCDVFYIGATKNGALLGEAIVFNDPVLAKGFDFSLKQKGALLAKGRVLGVQFLTLFKENLYWALAQHANDMAGQLADHFSSKGYEFLEEPMTNQLFPILPLSLIDELNKHFDFYIWKEISKDTAAIRLITSWATPQSEIDAFIKYIK